jgi:hypothetical protein
MTTGRKPKRTTGRGMFRGLPQTGYAPLGRLFLQDKELSGEARMVGAYLLSKPQGWSVDIDDLIRNLRWKTDRIYRYLAELIDHGYCVRRRVQGEDGMFDGSEYVVADVKEAILAQRQEWIEAGYKFYPSDEKRYAAHEQEQEHAAGDASATENSAPCRVLPDTVQPYTVKPDDVYNIDRNKPPPQSPPASAAGYFEKRNGAAPDAPAAAPLTSGASGQRGEREGPPPSLAPQSEQAHRSAPPATGAPPTVPDGHAGQSSTVTASGTAEGQPRKDFLQNSPATLRPVTFLDFWREYEPHSGSRRDKAVDAWDRLDADKRLHAFSVLPQYFGHMGKINKKPLPAWRYLRLGAFRDYALPVAPREPGDVAAPVRPVPPSSDEVLASPLGLRAAEGRWALELVEFIERQRRLPGEGECTDLARRGRARHRELLADEAAVTAGTMVAPMLQALLGKRRMLIEKALRKHGRAPPASEDDGGGLEPEDELADFT